MRIWWKRLAGKARENRQHIITATVVLLCVGLLLYGYTLSMRAALQQMLEDLPVVKLLPPSDSQGESEPSQPTSGSAGEDGEDGAGPAAPERPAHAETLIDLDGLRLAWPLLGGDVITTFGWNYSQTFADWRYHSGTDIKGNPNQAVRAARDGTVLQSGECEWFGRMVLIQHEAGLMTFYGHLGDILVSPGQQVAGEEVIAQLGAVGPAEAAEDEDFLHFEVLVQGESVDPMMFLR